MAIEGIGDYDDLMYYGSMRENVLSFQKCDLLLQTKVSELFKAEMQNPKLHPRSAREIQPFMVKVAYSEKDKDGKEKKVEVTVDTRDEAKKKESKETKSEEKKDQDQGK